MENSTSTPSNKNHNDAKSDWIYRYDPDTYVLESAYESQERYEADSLAERIAAGRENLFHNYLQENTYPNDATTAMANAITKLRGLGLLPALRGNDNTRAACLIHALHGQGFQIEPIRQLPDPKPVVHRTHHSDSRYLHIHPAVGFPGVPLGEKHLAVVSENGGLIKITIVDNESLRPMYIKTSNIEEIQELIDQLQSIVNLIKRCSGQRG